MKKVLVIVDMQKDFTSGALGNEACEAAVNEVVKVVSEGDYEAVIFTRDTHFDNYMSTQEGRKLPVVHCIEGSEGWQVREEIVKAVEAKYSAENITYIDKPTFGSLKLAELLTKKYAGAQEETEIHFCGVCTGICVISNVALAKAALTESKVCVIEKACACVTKDTHNTAIAAMKTFQVDIM